MQSSYARTTFRAASAIFTGSFVLLTAASAFSGETAAGHTVSLTAACANAGEPLTQRAAIKMRTPHTRFMPEDFTDFRIAPPYFTEFSSQEYVSIPVTLPGLRSVQRA